MAADQAGIGEHPALQLSGNHVGDGHRKDDLRRREHLAPVLAMVRSLDHVALEQRSLDDDAQCAGPVGVDQAAWVARLTVQRDPHLAWTGASGRVSQAQAHLRPTAWPYIPQFTKSFAIVTIQGYPARAHRMADQATARMPAATRSSVRSVSAAMHSRPSLTP